MPHTFIRSEHIGDAVLAPLADESCTAHLEQLATYFKELNRNVIGDFACNYLENKLQELYDNLDPANEEGRNTFLALFSATDMANEISIVANGLLVEMESGE